MTNHSIEELKKQSNAALSRLNEAKKSAAFAEKRLHDEMCRQSGLMGKVVSDKNRSVFVHDVRFMGDKPWMVKGFKIKKDGKPGEVEVSVYLNGEETISEYVA